MKAKDKCKCGNVKLKKSKLCNTCSRIAKRTTGFFAPKPFENYWCQPPVLSNAGRYIVRFVKPDGKGSSTPLSRFLMSIALGRILLPAEHVDHVDTIPTNDSIGNLQVLSSFDNMSKGSELNRSVSVISGKCPICKTKFQRRGKLEYFDPNRVFTCSKTCSGKVSFSKLSRSKLRTMSNLRDVYVSVYLDTTGIRIQRVNRNLKRVLKILEQHGFDLH